MTRPGSAKKRPDPKILRDPSGQKIKPIFSNLRFHDKN